MDAFLRSFSAFPDSHGYFRMAQASISLRAKEFHHGSAWHGSKVSFSATSVTLSLPVVQKRNSFLRGASLFEDQKWELSILANVSGFYQKLLRDHLQGELPVHPGLEDEAIHNASTNLRDILGKMHRWLQLLDMAISPAMVRQALTADTDPEIAEALLRYYTRKRDFTEPDRDKTDLVATFLYRHPRVPGQW